MIDVDNKADLDDILQKTPKVLVLFYASWCPFCRSFLPAFSRNTAQFKAAPIIRVLLDDYNSPLWDDYEIEAVPTIIYFEKGKVNKRLDGRSGIGLSERQLTAWLEKF